MTIFFLEYRNISIFLFMFFWISYNATLASVYILIYISKVNLEKSSAYECGFQPFSETSYPFELLFINYMNGYIRTKTKLSISSHTKHTVSSVFSIKSFLLCNNIKGSITKLISKPYKGKITSRTMMINARSLNHAARAAYYVFQSLTNDELVDSVLKNNKQLLVDSLVKMSLDSSQGISQHKAKLVQILLPQKFHSEQMHESFLENLKENTRIYSSIVKNEKNSLN